MWCLDNLGAKPYFSHPLSHIPLTGGMGVVLNVMQPLAEEEKLSKDTGILLFYCQPSETMTPKELRLLQESNAQGKERLKPGAS